MPGCQGGEPPSVPIQRPQPRARQSVIPDGFAADRAPTCEDNTNTFDSLAESRTDSMPFAVFRRYQKTMMAGLALFAMVAFTLDFSLLRFGRAPVISTSGTSRTTGSNSTANRSTRTTFRA